jgi:hypothetical protein
MIVQSTGGSMLVWLMRCDRPSERDTEWLLFGPTDEAVVEPAKVSEASCGSVPNTGPPSPG